MTNNNPDNITSTADELSEDTVQDKSLNDNSDTPPEAPTASASPAAEGSAESQAKGSASKKSKYIIIGLTIAVVWIVSIILAVVITGNQSRKDESSEDLAVVESSVDEDSGEGLVSDAESSADTDESISAESSTDDSTPEESTASEADTPCPICGNTLSDQDLEDFLGAFCSDCAHCRLCDSPITYEEYISADDFICTDCYPHYSNDYGVCEICDKSLTFEENLDSNGTRCFGCTDCQSCHSFLSLNDYNITNQLLCVDCYNAPTAWCPRCGQGVGVMNAAVDGFHCPSCSLVFSKDGSSYEEEPNTWCPECGHGFFITGVGVDGFHCPECFYNWGSMLKASWCPDCGCGVSSEDNYVDGYHCTNCGNIFTEDEVEILDHCGMCGQCVTILHLALDGFHCPFCKHIW